MTEHSKNRTAEVIYLLFDELIEKGQVREATKIHRKLKARLERQKKRLQQQGNGVILPSVG